MTAWWERHQAVVLLLGAALGAAVGLLAPAAAPALEAATTPVLVLLLCATFLGVPLGGLPRALRDGRFLLAVLGLSFLVAPLVVLVLTRLVADDEGLLVGVALVLLAPCVDYVVAFTRLAGGNAVRLLAATPVLMVLQVLFLPLLLSLVGGSAAAAIDPAPFLQALGLLVLLPLAFAGAVQLAAHATPLVAGVPRAAEGLLVPLTALTIVVVVGAQLPAVGAEAASLVRLVPLYVVFAAVMVAAGLLLSRSLALGPRRARAVALSGATRNSLVVLPLALALPPTLGLAPLAVVTQTVVELVVLVVLVRLLPRLAPLRSARSDGDVVGGDAA